MGLLIRTCLGGIADSDWSWLTGLGGTADSDWSYLTGRGGTKRTRPTGETAIKKTRQDLYLAGGVESKSYCSMVHLLDLHTGKKTTAVHCKTQKCPLLT